jgi:DNA-binding NarL/FixJ family response regulator
VIYRRATDERRIVHRCATTDARLQSSEQPRIDRRLFQTATGRPGLPHVYNQRARRPMKARSAERSMMEQTTAERIRVVVVAPYPTTRTGLGAVVATDPAFTVAGEAESVDALGNRLELMAPHVILLDPGNDLDAALQGLLPLSGSGLLPPIVLIAQTVEVAADAVDDGMQGVLLADATAEEIVAALHAVLAGLTTLDGRVVRAILERRAPSSTSPTPDGELDALTRREHEVLQLIAQGLPNKTIAAELGISEHTVKFHVGSILAKLDASSRAEALARAARQGLIVL